MLLLTLFAGNPGDIGPILNGILVGLVASTGACAFVQVGRVVLSIERGRGSAKIGTIQGPTLHGMLTGLHTPETTGVRSRGYQWHPNPASPKPQCFPNPNS